jgi:putative sigma-54 modulation protein
VQVAITCRHGTISDGVRGYITTKSEKLLTYFERVSAIQVTVIFEKDRVKSEILVDVEHRHDFVASDVGDDVMATFDKALHKMEQQVRKYKEKLQDHRRDLPLNELSSTDDVTEEGEENS